MHTETDIEKVWRRMAGRLHRDLKRIRDARALDGDRLRAIADEALRREKQKNAGLLDEMQQAQKTLCRLIVAAKGVVSLYDGKDDIPSVVAELRDCLGDEKSI